MSNRDYTKFTKHPVKAVAEAEEIQNGVEEIVEEESKLVGVVVDCYKLNIRMEPDVDAEIIGTIPVGSEVTIEDFTLDEFYKVCTAAGAEGFCMKSYIQIK